MRTVTRIVALALCLGAGACVTQKNYEPDAPRYAGGGPAGASPRDTLKVVSFNVEFAMRIDSAIAALGEPDARDADVILLQEMDEQGTRRIAAAVGMWYVYYPATRHMRTGRDFGNAVLSRFPIIDDSRILLPHAAAIGESRRSATAATIMTGDTEVRLYSTHLGTVANITKAQRRDQLLTILRDADRYPRVILGGDMNDPGVAEVSGEWGYVWPTRRIPRSASSGRLDHILLKGIAAPTDAGAGTIADHHGASDHRPIWSLAILR